MVFENFIDISDDDISISDLQKLDKQSEKAIKNLEKLQRKARGVLPKDRILPQTGFGPLANIPSGTRNREQEKIDRQIEKKLQRIQEKIRKDEVRNFGKKDSLFSEILGESPAQTLFSFGKNPIGFLQNALVGAAGVGFAVQIAQQVIQEIQKIDRFLKVFVDRIDDRVDALRSKQQQAFIAAGLSQQIITTRAGNTSARDSYNTFAEFNNNRAKLEDDFAIRNTAGVE